MAWARETDAQSIASGRPEQRRSGVVHGAYARSGGEARLGLDVTDLVALSHAAETARLGRHRTGSARREPGGEDLALA
jgi:hypothetical protein